MSNSPPLSRAPTLNGDGPEPSNSDETAPNPVPPPPNSVISTFLDVHDPVPPISMDEVANTLAPIEERLNEEAEEAQCPEPAHTPLTGSPVPTLIGRQQQRTRGMSNLGQRLENLQIAQLASAAINESNEQSSQANERAPDDQDEQPFSAGTTNEHHSAPRGHHGVEPPVLSLSGLESSAHDSRRESGVTESSIWEDEAMDNMENAIRRLEQLAQDEATKTGKTTQQCFLARLKRAIDSASTLFNGDIQFLGEESANPQ